MNNHYYKCKACLHPVVITSDQVKMISGRKDLQCECGGKMDHMGQVYQENKYKKTEEQCACDERCVSATGPKCVCGCHGENHGSGLMIEVVVETGKVVFKAFTPEDIERGHIYLAKEKELSSLFSQHWAPVVKDINSGKWTNLWHDYRDAHQDYIKAINGKAYKNRDKKLDLLIELYKNKMGI